MTRTTLSSPLPVRGDVHLARRLWHFGGVLTMFVLANVFTHRHAVEFTVVGSLAMIGFDYARLKSPALNRFFSWAFGPVLRESERERVAGSTYMMIGVTIVVCFYPQPVVLLTLLMFSLADPLASYVGIRYGREKLIGQKTLAGALAAFVACFACALLFYSAWGLMRERLFIVCLLSAWIGALAELIPIRSIDDNLSFPIVAATLLSGLMYIFGGL